MFGFGEDQKEGWLGKPGKVKKPVKLDHFGDVEFVDAGNRACRIDQSGNLFWSNTFKQTGLTTRPKLATCKIGVASYFTDPFYGVP